MLNLAAFIWLKIHFSYKEGSDKSGKGQGERAKLHEKKKKLDCAILNFSARSEQVWKTPSMDKSEKYKAPVFP